MRHKLASGKEMCTKCKHLPRIMSRKGSDSQRVRSVCIPACVEVMGLARWGHGGVRAIRILPCGPEGLNPPEVGGKGAKAWSGSGSFT